VNENDYCNRSKKGRIKKNRSRTISERGGGPTLAAAGWKNSLTNERRHKKP
jgi:hypothetical protein